MMTHSTAATQIGEHIRTTDKRDSIIRELTAERDALMAAGKLAVEALDDWYYGANQDRPKAAVYVALQALKQAGVQ